MRRHRVAANSTDETENNTKSSQISKRVHTTQQQHSLSEIQLQKQITELQGIIQLQNKVIIGIFTCFVVVIVICSIFVLQHLPTPNDDLDLYKSNVRGKVRNNKPLQVADDIHKKSSQQLKNNSIRKQHEPYNNFICSSFGCSLRPIELVDLQLQLNNNSNTHFNNQHIASSNHIIMTHKSNRKKPAPINQDKSILIPSFSSSDNHKTTNSKALKDINAKGNFFLGVFDGHDDNGHDVAQFASDEIPLRISNKLQASNISIPTKFHPIEENNHTISTIKDIITSTFIEVDNEAPTTGGGCTATIIFRRGSTLFMANTGDSSQLLVVYTPPNHFNKDIIQSNARYIQSPRSPDIQLHLQGKISLHYQSAKHKAHFPKERDRIEGLGGKIHVPPKNPMGSLVIVRSSLHGEDVGLAMSRSIGDREWTAVGVIPDPDVRVVNLDDFFLEHVYSSGGEESEKKKKVFALLGSDGLFDARQAEFVGRHLAYGMFESSIPLHDNNDMNDDVEQQTQHDNNNNDDKEEAFSKHMIEVGAKLVQMASPLKEEWYRDDITFVAKVIEL